MIAFQWIDAGDGIYVAFFMGCSFLVEIFFASPARTVPNGCFDTWDKLSCINFANGSVFEQIANLEIPTSIQYFGEIELNEVSLT